MPVSQLVILASSQSLEVLSALCWLIVLLLKSLLYLPPQGLHTHQHTDKQLPVIAPLGCEGVSIKLFPSCALDVSLRGLLAHEKL